MLTFSFEMSSGIKKIIFLHDYQNKNRKTTLNDNEIKQTACNMDIDLMSVLFSSQMLGLGWQKIKKISRQNVK